VAEQHVRLENYGDRCRVSVLMNILFFAVSRISSIFAACRNLADAPTQQTVFNALVVTLNRPLRGGIGLAIAVWRN
jgi:hypothetical protein